MIKEDKKKKKKGILSPLPEKMGLGETGTRNAPPAPQPQMGLNIPQLADIAMANRGRESDGATQTKNKFARKSGMTREELFPG